MSSVSFSICSFIYIIIFAVVYFKKNRINLVENKVYTCLLITTIIGLSIDIIGYFAFQDKITDSFKNLSIAKIYALYYFTYTYLLMIYTYIVSFKSKYGEGSDYYRSLFKKLIFVYLIFSIVVLLLPISIKNNSDAIYSYGPSVNLVYLLSGICMVVMILCLIKNVKNIRRKEYIPLFALIIFGCIAMIIQHQYPNLLLLISCQSVVTALMYFTIENPDMQMVEELNKNRKLTEQNFEEKTNFLFKISQDLKKPLLDIGSLSSQIMDSSSGEVKEQARVINSSAKQLYTYVNNALDVSNMDIKNLKIIEGPYNTFNFFEEIKLRIKQEIKNQKKNIEFRCDISSSIPELLSGDNIKLKQIILAVVFDSIKHTDSGFIELSVNSIIKYGICRLLIEISDSGEGMELDKINNILNTTEVITTEEVEKIDKLDISIPLAHKIIKALNGNFIIRSELKSGTNFLIIIDQKIEEKEKTEALKKIENYEKKILTSKEVLVVSNDTVFTNKITKIMEMKDIKVVVSLYGKDCIDKINNKEKYECILIDDILNGESGFDILKGLKKFKNFKIPTFIIINKNKEFMSKHYLSDGFDEYIVKDDIENEIRKINKYL